MIRAAWLALVVTLSGCAGPKIQDCKIRCGPQGQCPDDTSCSAADGMCRPAGATGVCRCTAGEARDCDAGFGPCALGTQSCREDQRWGACAAVITSDPEICDGEDNNCDGRVDQLAPQLIAPAVAGFSTAAFSGGLAVLWATNASSGSGYALWWRIFDEAMRPLTGVTKLADVGAPLRFETAAIGDTVWLVWQGADGASASGVRLSASNGWTPVPLPGLPRPEATGRLWIAGSPSGLVGVWPVGAGLRAGLWPGSGAAPLTADYGPFPALASIDQVVLSSRGTAVSLRGIPDGGGSGIETLSLDGGQRSQLPIYNRLLDTSTGVMSFWPELATNGSDALLVGRADVFSGAQLTFRAVVQNATAIDACWSENTPSGPLLLWRELGVLNLGLPSFAGSGSIVRALRMETDGGIPIAAQPANGGTQTMTSVFYVTDTNLDLSVIQSCAP